MTSILILHGWGSKADNWVRVKEGLSKQGYRVFVPDLPGFGKNPPPPNPWSINDYVNWVKKYIEDLRLKNELTEPFFLVGHSFGGGLAVILASILSDRIKGLILVAAKIHKHKTIKYYLGLILSKAGILIFSVPLLSSFRPLARRILYFLLGTRDYYKLEIQRAVIMKETFKQIIRTDLSEFLQIINAPTLIIWGKKDKATPLKDAYFIKKRINNSQLEIIPGGHMPNLETPEVLVEKIINFINRFPKSPISGGLPADR